MFNASVVDNEVVDAVVTDVLSEDAAVVNDILVDAVAVTGVRPYVVNTNKAVRICIVLFSFCITLAVLSNALFFYQCIHNFFGSLSFR